VKGRFFLNFVASTVGCFSRVNSEYPIVDGEPEIPTHFKGNIPLGYLGGISQAF